MLVRGEAGDWLIIFLYRSPTYLMGHGLSLNTEPPFLPGWLASKSPGSTSLCPLPQHYGFSPLSAMSPHLPFTWVLKI